MSDNGTNPKGTATTMEQLEEQLTTALSEKNAAIAQVTELQSEVTYYQTVLEKIDKTLQSINKLESSVRKETRTKIANMVHNHRTELTTTKHQLKQKHEQLLAASTQTSALSLELATANAKAESQTRKVITVMGELVNTALKLECAEKRLAALDASFKPSQKPVDAAQHRRVEPASANALHKSPDNNNNNNTTASHRASITVLGEQLAEAEALLEAKDAELVRLRSEPAIDDAGIARNERLRREDGRFGDADGAFVGKCIADAEEQARAGSAAIES